MPGKGMKLEPEHEMMLAGESGKAIASAMMTLIAYGKSFGAGRMVPVKSCHLAGTFGINIYKAYLLILKQLVKEGVTCKVLTTVNPRPGDDLNIGNKFVFAKQKILETLLADLGVVPNYSCVCYDTINTPKPGECISWAESSAVQYANSVLGARTNRNSILIDICSAVTGYTPEFGYLLDENRHGRILVNLKINEMDASGLGFLIGKKVVNKVPVIENYNFSKIELKNMGGAMAASGGVALFHVEGVTPEAPDLKTVFDGDPEEVITITQNDLNALRTKDTDTATSVVFGCPQMTYEEVMILGQHFVGKKTKLPTWFCMIPEASKCFKGSELYTKVVEAGVKIVDFCPLAAFSLRMGNKRLLTSSGKLYYYLSDTIYGTVKDCLKACGV
jgi:cis-L-3-hydroxyproline dehydratase